MRKHVVNNNLKQFLLVEMVARYVDISYCSVILMQYDIDIIYRVVKNIIRQKLRDKMKGLATLEEGSYIKACAINVILV